jgi:DNA repair protein RecO (recombination protein O)
MEWEAPAIVLDARAYGEGGALITLLTEEHGAYRALARGGGSKAQAALWQRGNVVQARWIARLSDQLGSVTAELLHAGAAGSMDDPLPLAILASACAVAEGALPEREPHPLAFLGLVHILAALSIVDESLPLLIRWEALLLAELGYGLDLSSCAITGAESGLAYVSPRTGRAVAREAAGVWESRLLRLPGLLTGGNSAGPTDWQDGLKLTGHFLARDAFGQHHRPLPAARDALYGLVLALAPSDRHV